MRNIFLALTVFASLLYCSTCNGQAANPTVKSIKVSGSAEMEVTPDEIYFTIVLEEYIPEKEKGKTGIEKLEKDLQSAVAAAGVSKDNLTIENIYGENWVYKKQKQKDFLEKKKYLLKLNDPSRIDAILDKLDQKAIDNVYISRYWHSKIEEYRKQLKIQAIKNAKEKASYLLEAIGEQLGKPISISETKNGFAIYPPLNASPEALLMSNSSYSMDSKDSDYSGSVGIKKIKLRMEIYTEFEIK